MRPAFPPSLTPFPQPASLTDPAGYEQSVRGRQPQHRRKEQLPGRRAGRLQLGSTVVWWGAVWLGAVSGLLGCEWGHPEHPAHREPAERGWGWGRVALRPAWLQVGSGVWGLLCGVGTTCRLPRPPGPPTLVGVELTPLTGPGRASRKSPHCAGWCGPPGCDFRLGSACGAPVRTRLVCPGRAPQGDF